MFSVNVISETAIAFGWGCRCYRGYETVTETFHVARDCRDCTVTDTTVG